MYATLEKFLSGLGPPSKEAIPAGSNRKAAARKLKAKTAVRRKSKMAVYTTVMNDSGIIDLHIELEEDKQTSAAKKSGRKK